MTLVHQQKRRSGSRIEAHSRASLAIERTASRANSKTFDQRIATGFGIVLGLLLVVNASLRG